MYMTDPNDKRRIIITELPPVSYRRLHAGVYGYKYSDEPRKRFVLNKIRNCINAKQYDKWRKEYERC